MRGETPCAVIIKSPISGEINYFLCASDAQGVYYISPRMLMQPALGLSSASNAVQMAPHYSIKGAARYAHT